MVKMSKLYTSSLKLKIVSIIYKWLKGKHVNIIHKWIKG